MQIIHLPDPMPKRSDDPPTWASIASAKVAATQELVDAVADPRDPPYVQALKGALPPETCGACGHPRDAHYDASKMYLLGCLPPTPPRNPHPTFGIYPAVTLAVRTALLTGRCGPAITEFFKLLPIDDQTAIAHVVSHVAIAQYIRDGEQP